jgi:hypothetical protein
MRQDDAELIVQTMKQGPKIADVWRELAILNHVHGLRRRSRCRRAHSVRLPPQRVREDPDAATSRPHILDLAGRDPVVDRSAADAHHFARLHDADRLALHSLRVPPSRGIGPSAPRIRPIDEIAGIAIP